MSSLFIFSISIHIQLAIFTGVFVSVESKEEEPVETAVEHDHEVHPQGVTTAGVYQGHQTVNEDDLELDHLHRGEIFLEARTCRGQEVVGVHEDVDQRVPHSSEGCVAAACDQTGPLEVPDQNT